MKKKQIQTLLPIILILSGFVSSSFRPIKILNESIVPGNEKYEADSIVYNSLKGIIGTRFYKENNSGAFNHLCVQDCFSFTFLLQGNGKISIQEFSMYTPREIERLVERSVSDLNELPIVNKPFVKIWLRNKYENQLMIQPILVNLFSETCLHPNDLKHRGILSLLTKKQDSGRNVKGSEMTPSGEFDAPPFNGILLSPFVLQSPFR